MKRDEEWTDVFPKEFEEPAPRPASKSTSQRGFVAQFRASVSPGSSKELNASREELKALSDAHENVELAEKESIAKERVAALERGMADLRAELKEVSDARDRAEAKTAELSMSFDAAKEEADARFEKLEGKDDVVRAALEAQLKSQMTEAFAAVNATHTEAFAAISEANAASEIRAVKAEKREKELEAMIESEKASHLLTTNSLTSTESALAQLELRLQLSETESAEAAQLAEKKIDYHMREAREAVAAKNTADALAAALQKRADESSSALGDEKSSAVEAVRSANAHAAALQLKNEEFGARKTQQPEDDAARFAALERLGETRATELYQERLDAAEAAVKAEHIIVIGNPGGGKSTLLNSLMKSLCGFNDAPVFESGISCLHGLTTECKRYECINQVAFVDTPGLADVNEREHAAEQISAALSMPAMCKIIFVVAFLDVKAVHMRSEDWATLQLVIESLLEACITVEELNFAVVFNKVPKGKVELEPLEVVAKFNSGEVRKKIPIVNQICIEEDPDLEDGTGMLELSDQFVKFIKDLPYVRLGEQKVNIKHDKFEQLIKKHQMEMESLREKIKNNSMPEDTFEPEEQPEQQKDTSGPEQQEDASKPEQQEDGLLSWQKKSEEPRAAFKKRRILCIGNAGAGTTKIKEMMKESVAPAEKDKFEFFEAKGLADAQSRRKNAKKITSLLKSNCEYSIFFVLTLEAGRLRPEDRETMQLVHDAVPFMGNRYSVIINKMTEQSMGLFKSPESFEQLGGKLFFRPACKDKEKSTIYFIKKNTDGRLQLPGQLVERCPSLDIREYDVLDVNFETLEDRAEQLRKELDELEKTTTTLEEEYKTWKNYIDCSKIRWIKVGYLQQLTRDRKRLPRCQDLQDSEYEIGSRGNFQDDCVHISRWVVSHPWRSPRHPDPDCVQLQWVCKELCRFGARDVDLLFYDYAGLLQNDNFNEDFWSLCCERFEQKKRGLPDTEWAPWPEAGGHPAVRTEAEEALFKDTQLRKLELLFCFRGMKVLIAPIPPYADQEDGVMLGGNCPANPRMYKARGWCLFEFAVASVFNRIVNGDHKDVQKFCDVEVNDPDQFSNAFSKVEFTNNGDKQVVIDMFNRIFESRPEIMNILGPGRDALSANKELQFPPNKSSGRAEAEAPALPDTTVDGDVQIIYEEMVVEVPQVEMREVIKQVPKPIVQYVDKQIPKPVLQVVEKVVEAPDPRSKVREVQEVIVEVPEIEVRELVKQVPVPTVEIIQKQVPVPTYEYIEKIVEVPNMKDEFQVVYIDRKVPKIVVQYVEKIVEVPQVVLEERAIEVPQMLAVEAIKNVNSRAPSDGPHEIVHKQVAKPEIQLVERMVEVPCVEVQEEIIEVPQVQVREIMRQVPRNR